MALVKRSEKIGPLTIQEHDGNIDHLSDGNNIAAAVDAHLQRDDWRKGPPASIADAGDGNAEIQGDGLGIYIRQPDGTRRLLQINDAGLLTIDGEPIGAVSDTVEATFADGTTANYADGVALTFNAAA